MSKSDATPAYTFWLFVLLAAVTLHRTLVQAWLGHDLYMDEAQYWSWSQFMAWGYYSKPPVVAAIIWATTQLFGSSELAVRAGSLIIHPLTALVMYALGTRLFDRRIGFWSAVTFILLPSIMLSSQIITTDVPLLFFWALGLYALVRALDTDAWRHWLLLGAAVGLGLLAKYTMVVFALSLLLYLLVTPSRYAQFRNPKLYVAVVLGALILLPNMLWNAANGWITFVHTAHISHLATEQSIFHPMKLAEFLFGQLGMAGPIFFGVIVTAIILLLRDWKNDQVRLLACFSLPMLLGICGQALLAKANANWAAPTYVPATVWGVYLLLRGNRRKLLIAALAANIALGGFVLHFEQIMGTLGIQITKKIDFAKSMRGWRATGEALSAIWARHPDTRLLFDNRTDIAQMLYYVHPHPFNSVTWNPSGVINSHYDLTTRLEPGKQAWLYMTSQHPLPAAVASRFTSNQPLEHIQVSMLPGEQRNLYVYLLKGFKGYAQ